MHKLSYLSEKFETASIFAVIRSCKQLIGINQMILPWYLHIRTLWCKLNKVQIWYIKGCS